MPPCSHDACSASESPQCPGGEMERARGPQMNSRERAGIFRGDPATRFQLLSWLEEKPSDRLLYIQISDLSPHLKAQLSLDFS